MQTRSYWLATYLVMSLALGYGCQPTERAEELQWVQVPIVDASDVAGKWDGLMRRIPPYFQRSSNSGLKSRKFESLCRNTSSMCSGGLIG